MSTGEQEPVLRGLSALRTTKYGKQYQQDTWDLLCNFALSVRPRVHRQMAVKSIPDCFAGNEAVAALASLKFLRSPNSNDFSNIVPSSTWMLKLQPDDAKILMQNFIEAGLITSATGNDDMPTFTKGGLYKFTLKGLRVLEEFIEQNAIESEADHLVAILSTLPMPRPKLWRLQRQSSSQDELVTSQHIVTNIFRHFVGSAPNYGLGNTAGVRLVPFPTKRKLLDGLFLEGARPLDGKVSEMATTHCFKVSEMIHWLCRCTSINGHADAVVMGAHFVRFSLITLAKDNAKKQDPTKIFTAKGHASTLNPLIKEEGQFLFSQNAIYAITDEGRRVARWTTSYDSSSRVRNITTGDLPTNPAQARYDAIFSQPFDETSLNATRLRKFIDQPRMRAQFREYLTEESVDYYLSFYLNVEDFRIESEKAFSASARPRRIVPETPPVASSSRMPLEMLEPEWQEPVEPQYYESLSEIPFLIYNAYLAPSSNCGLRFHIGEDVLKETQVSLEDILEYLTNKALVADVEPAESRALDIGQLQVLLELYGRIQSRVFRILALEYVPRFIKSPKFLAERLNTAHEFEQIDN